MNSSLIESYLLNLAITSNDPHYFSRLGLNAEWFSTHKQVYEKFVEHCQKYAEVPSLAWLVSETDTAFSYEEVDESAETLVQKLRESRAKADKKNVLQRIASDWATIDADEITARVKTEMDAIDVKYGLTAQTQSNWTVDTEQRVMSYEQRKSSQQKLIYSGFDSWNKNIGPFRPGDYVVVYSEPKRGKSHVSRAFVTLPAVRQGFRVLEYALEQPRVEVEAIYDSLESAYMGVYEYNGQPSGFSEKQILRGQLEDEEAYREFVTMIDRKKLGYGDLIIKTLEDDDLVACDMAKIEADIDLYKPDIVLVDQASLMTYERIKETTNGGAAAATSRRFRKMCIKKGVIGCMIVQASIESSKSEDDGERVLEPPDAMRVKTTKGFIEDCTILVPFDSVAGKAVLKCERGRMGGAGFTVDLQFFPDRGIVREIVPADMF